MSYIAPLRIEDAVRSLCPDYDTAIEPRHAVEAAKILLARSPAHAMRFALAMHKRVATGLNTDMIEHWARVVTVLGWHFTYR
jgi:hypothetical protein